MKRSEIDKITNEQISPVLSRFDRANWLWEPQETFKELCGLRARQLRDSYDHIILSFSGGSDSTTVLNSFLNNNIPIDEILIVSCDIDAPCVNGKKALEDLRIKNYTGIVNHVYLTCDNVINYLKTPNVINQSPNFSGNLHSIMRFNTHYLEHYGFCSVKKRNGKICHLYGEKDPDVFIMGDSINARMCVKNEFVSSHDSMNTLFFTDPAFPQLHVKQCYVVGKALTRNPNLTHRQKKNLVRDEYLPLISPTKSSNDPNFVKNNLNTYSEASVLFAEFSKNQEFMKYYLPVLEPQFEINKKIQELTVNNYKYYSLKLRTKTPSY